MNRHYCQRFSSSEEWKAEQSQRNVSISHSRARRSNARPPGIIFQFNCNLTNQISRCAISVGLQNCVLTRHVIRCRMLACACVCPLQVVLRSALALALLRSAHASNLLCARNTRTAHFCQLIDQTQTLGDDCAICAESVYPVVWQVALSYLF
jgi:hypothetical protein